MDRYQRYIGDPDVEYTITEFRGLVDRYLSEALMLPEGTKDMYLKFGRDNLKRLTIKGETNEN